MMKIAIAATAVASVISVSITRISAQAPAAHAVLKTSWGDPDLQGIWTDETATPLQRSPKYANQEFFTQGQRAELDAARAAMLGRDKRVERGTELDVAGAYNAQFASVKRTGPRTSMIVDPANGRMPPMTPEAQKIVAADRQFRLALLPLYQVSRSGVGRGSVVTATSRERTSTRGRGPGHVLPDAGQRGVGRTADYYIDLLAHAWYKEIARASSPPSQVPMG